VAALVALVLLAGIWWPSGQYEPVRADERGTLTGLVSDDRPAAALDDGRVLGMALVPRSGSGPTLVVLPTDDGALGIVTSAHGSEPMEGRSFPFALPDAPGPGDNQALAVGDEDGATVYDVAYAVVTVTDGAPVTSTNEAYALASCSFCKTVAVAMQIVLVVGQADVVVPVNTAVAGNADCFSCVTSALAVQLVATIDALPSQEVYDRLADATAQLEGLGDLDTQQLWDSVQAVEVEVAQILTEAGLLDGVTTATASASASPSESPSPSASPTAVVPTAEPSSSAPEATPESSPSASPPATPEPTASPEPTAAATP
jgi:putative peptide zinc metalloprotease protein